MVVLGKKIGAGSIRFNHVFFGGNAACFAESLYLSPEEELEAVEEVNKLNKEFPGFIIPTSTFLALKDKLGRLGEYTPSYDKIVIPPCGAAMSKAAIRPDGWVTPCEVVWEVKCGNLKERSLKEIWEDSEAMNSFRKPLEIDLDQIPECKGCSHQYICFIGHRCNPYYYTGGIKNRKLYCWFKEEKNIT